MRVALPTFAIWLGLMAFACGPSSTGGHGELVSIEVEPANATLTYTDVSPTLDYRAIGHYADGHTEELPDASFALDGAGALLGTLTTTTFTAHGEGAGKGGVFAQVGDLVGSTSVIVVVHRTDLGPGVPPDGATRFPDVSPPGAQSATLVYPLDGAVMPSSVRPPIVQWEGPSAVDHLFRVRLTAGLATVDTIVADAPGFKFDLAVPPVIWQLLKTSAGTGTITATVDHWDAVTGPQGGAPVVMTMVSANITGAIYYWNLAAGRMERIDEAGRAPAIPNPPRRGSEPNNRCVACHTVSKDGRYLSGAMWGGAREGAVYDLSDPTVRTADPAPTVAPLVEGSSYTVLFSSFNADSSRLMVNRTTRLDVLDPKTGAFVPTTGTPLPTVGAAHPSWSPDGTTVAYVANVLNNGTAAVWAVDYTRGDLAVLPVTGPDAFGPSTTLVPAAAVDPAFAAPSWPTFSPDSQYIAYGAGTNSRARNDTIPAVYPGALYVIHKDGGIAHRLDIACAAARDCHLPNFSPYDAGGYFWLVFYSTRDYGNVPAGTKGTQRRQLWVTAIDKAKLAAGVDASSVPYWLPEQDVTSQNMSAYWALPPPIQ